MTALLELGFTRVQEPVATDAVRVGRRGWRLSEAVAAMGTRVSLMAIDPSRRRAEEALGRAREEMVRVVALLNRFDEDSAVTSLNRDGVLRDAPAELLDVLRVARSVQQPSGGAFDVTVQPVIDLLRQRRAAGLDGTPPAAVLLDAVSRTGADDLVLEGRDVTLRRPGMGITLDGIAKGYVVDRMATVLEESGAESYLIDGGGDVRSSGLRDGRQPWRVAVRDPDQEARPAAVIELSGGAVATSGGYELAYSDDESCHHIVDAETGRSPNACRSVTVRARSAVEADALATAAFVLGPVAGRSLVESRPQTECLILTAGGAVRSTGWSGAQEAAG